MEGGKGVDNVVYHVLLYIYQTEGSKKMEIKLYEVGQKIKNPRNGQIFEIAGREILEDAHVTLYKVATEYNGAKITVEMDGGKLNSMINSGLEVM